MAAAVTPATARWKGLPAVRRQRRAHHLADQPGEDVADAEDREDERGDRERAGRHGEQVAVADQALARIDDCSRRLTQAVAISRGSATTIETRVNTRTGTTTSTHSVTTPRAHGLSTVTLGSRQRHGSRLSRIGLMRW